MLKVHGHLIVHLFYKKTIKLKKPLDKQKSVCYYIWDKEAEQSHPALIAT